MSLLVPPFGSGQFVRLGVAIGSRIGRLIGFGVVLLGLAMPTTAQAGEVYFPGSVWTSNGSLSPVEKGNIISQTHVEQGIAINGAELFGQLTGVYDSKGYDWNRRFATGVGARFTQQLLGHGMVRVSASYLRERRYTFDITHEGLVVAAEAWFGWNNTPHP